MCATLPASTICKKLLREILIMGKKVPPTWWKKFEDDRPTLIGGSCSLVFQITLNSDECLRGFDF
ncbi:hypothetical protein T06_11185 [Trichinella sp. T6]|nr:hypothetical protein T06_11185 [Trichinella sp. T6]